MLCFAFMNVTIIMVCNNLNAKLNHSPGYHNGRELSSNPGSLLYFIPSHHLISISHLAALL